MGESQNDRSSASLDDNYSKEYTPVIHYATPSKTDETSFGPRINNTNKAHEKLDPTLYSLILSLYDMILPLFHSCGLMSCILLTMISLNYREILNSKNGNSKRKLEVFEDLDPSKAVQVQTHAERDIEFGISSHSRKGQKNSSSAGMSNANPAIINDTIYEFSDSSMMPL